jgi:N-acetyl-gamma-glutamyl-phosphate reductase
MIRAKVIGATGYGGLGIIELLLQHPEAEIVCLAAKASVGHPISEVYPHLDGHCDLDVIDADGSDVAADVVFMATPDRVGMERAGQEVEAGARVIDYSGDFRFGSADVYAEYARRIGIETAHAAPDLLDGSVYGLAELHRSEIGTTTSVVGNPGCFAVGCILGLAPAAKAGMAALDSWICDCKSGVSGAGKSPKPAFHYPARYENMNAYRLAGHQHVCEIEHELSLQAGGDVTITFTAQVVPTCRGIMSTLYGDADTGVTRDKLLDAYRDFYHDEPFVRVYDRDAVIGTADVSGSNRCNLVIDFDERTGKLRVVSYIDNLMKGQAGSALQNMNLLFGLDETTGLDRPAHYP